MAKKSFSIIQPPNTPLKLALVFFFLRFLGNPMLTTLSVWGTLLALLYWAYLEIFQGDNQFRKLLGLVVAAYVLYQLVGLLESVV
jgi:hypothetical protein